MLWTGKSVSKAGHLTKNTIDYERPKLKKTLLSPASSCGLRICGSDFIGQSFVDQSAKNDEIPTIFKTGICAKVVFVNYRFVYSTSIGGRVRRGVLRLDERDEYYDLFMT